MGHRLLQPTALRVSCVLLAALWVPATQVVRVVETRTAPGLAAHSPVLALLLGVDLARANDPVSDPVRPEGSSGKPQAELVQPVSEGAVPSRCQQLERLVSPDGQGGKAGACGLGLASGPVLCGLPGGLESLVGTGYRGLLPCAYSCSAWPRGPPPLCA